MEALEWGHNRVMLLAFLFGMTGLGYVWGNLMDSPDCIFDRHRRIGHVLVLFPSAKLVQFWSGFPLSRKKSRKDRRGGGCAGNDS